MESKMIYLLSEKDIISLLIRQLESHILPLSLSDISDINEATPLVSTKKLFKNE